MDPNELLQGLQNVQSAPAAADVPPEVPQEAPWQLDMNSLMSGYGSWFDNDQGLGELLLGQLRANGVDTQAATEAMLRQILQGLVDDINMLKQKLSAFTAQLTQQVAETQNVANAITTAIDQSNASIPPVNLPPELPGEMLDLPPEFGAPADMPPAPPAPPADTGATAELPAPEQPPADMPPAPPADTGAPPESQTPEQPPAGTVSDERVKKVQYTLSDASMKNIRAKIAARNNTAINPNILAGCSGGF